MVLSSYEMVYNFRKRVAHENKYRYLVLGAWGCGAFGNQVYQSE